MSHLRLPSSSALCQSNNVPHSSATFAISSLIVIPIDKADKAGYAFCLFSFSRMARMLVADGMRQAIEGRCKYHRFLHLRRF